MRKRHPPNGLILIVDDDRDIVEAMRLVLESAGHRVLTAEDGAVALRCLHSGVTPSLILLDLMMPVMSGQEFLERARRDPALATIPVVVVSAAGPAADKLPSEAIAGLLRKPFDIDGLLSAVQRFDGDAAPGA